MVYPSGLERIIWDTPTSLPPPSTFLIMMGFPKYFSAYFAPILVPISVPPPALKGTIRLTGFRRKISGGLPETNSGQEKYRQQKGKRYRRNLHLHGFPPFLPDAKLFSPFANKLKYRKAKMESQGKKILPEKPGNRGESGMKLRVPFLVLIKSHRPFSVRGYIFIFPHPLPLPGEREFLDKTRAIISG